MSLENTSFWKVIQSSFSQAIWKEVGPAVWDTVYMTVVSSVIMLLVGLIFGIILTWTDKGGIRSLPLLNGPFGWFINILRSLPQMIMIIIMIPVARGIFGQSYGTNPCIVAIAASCIPMYARMVESSLLEVEKGKIDAARSLGSSDFDIVFRVWIPEAIPSLVRGFTVSVIGIISMTALAGMFGAGGIGDIAVRYGYQRFQHDKLFACIYVLVVIVQLTQSAGNWISDHIRKKRGLM
ncbi:D-methionine transport system permease protein [Lachnospiraceae bacterium C10]|jgi:D-methionine transport system permease protein|nr:ABC transporter permease [Lachnospiraceae bacterium]SCW39833.1 D-methionine transport system permease protein [Lachnospiraceae bacterium C10]SDW57612.1 D-methionine transport system permease protein [Lachnospiraceae bacterium KHCPX20]